MLEQVAIFVATLFNFSFHNKVQVNQLRLLYLVSFALVLACCLKRSKECSLFMFLIGSLSGLLMVLDSYDFVKRVCASINSVCYLILLGQCLYLKNLEKTRLP